MLHHFTPPHLLTGLPPRTPILVALSGGADSVCLLACLREYAAAHGTPLRLCHVNHGIRGEEAVRDRDFCVALAARYGLPISVLDADVPALRAREGGSLEEVARRVRYDYFARIMAQYDIPLLATAHHADDQLETILLRLTRGTGPDGLCGIPPIRPMGQGRAVIRPLLLCERAEIEEYLAARGLSYVVDTTNADLSYARNRIRHTVIPQLRAINPAVARAATRLGESLQRDCETYRAEAEAFLSRHLVDKTYPTGYRWLSLPCESAARLSEATRRRAVAALMRRAGCPTVEESFVCRLSALAAGERGALTLPGGIEACGEGSRLDLHCERAAAVPAPLTFALTALPQTLSYSDITLSFTASPPDDCVPMEARGHAYQDPYTACLSVALPAEALRGPLTVRTRCEGDAVLCRGHHRKLKKLLSELGVPRALRDRLPILCDGEGILCIPGIAVRDDTDPHGDRVYLSTCPAYPEYTSASADLNRELQQKEEIDEE